ncbi:hypothetical protein L211DRAFT_865950 [Terfezia boudieri ATCC MYA-4762]|uniref:Uncharacterized protein n=1 Tax=Terfezia boudieri ATCC MYA-4762 TaxID=1051890 RepID=A0A3N4LW68_9PEZI|nr:hypothetical protein L211DRAFT_865950 [Terfezia boudieri ATCC MYA-4762]
MNRYQESNRADTPSEIEEIDNPTLDPSNYASPRMYKSDSAGVSPSPEVRSAITRVLNVDPTSDLTGYSYEGSHGRYVTFFWQSASNDFQDDSTKHSLSKRSAGIYHSTFLKTGTGWTLVGRPVLVTLNAKKQSPLAAVNWSNGLKGAVYYLNERHLVCEQLTIDGGKTWHEGSLTEWAIPARTNSDLSAMVNWESLKGMEIFLYFQDESNRIRELRFKAETREWYEDNIDLFNGLSGTSISRGADSGYNLRRSMYIQSSARVIDEFYYKENEWTLCKST